MIQTGGSDTHENGEIRDNHERKTSVGPSRSIINQNNGFEVRQSSGQGSIDIQNITRKIAQALSDPNAK